MSVSGIGGGISPLRGMEGVQAGGALGEHKVEQIENTRAEPRQTSIGSKIAAFFKGIGAFFANLKAEHNEAKAARKEAKAERAVTANAKAFAEGLAAPTPTASSAAFTKVMTLSVQRHGPEEGMTVALGKIMDAIDAMPDPGRTIAENHLKNFNEAGGIAAALTATFDASIARALEQDSTLRGYGLPGTLSGTDDLEGKREAFVDQLAAFGDALAAARERQEQMDHPITALVEGQMDGVLFDKLDQVFAKKFADENTKFIKAVNDWKGVIEGGDATLARDGFEALMDRFVRDTGSTQVDVTDQVMARLKAVADGAQPLTQDVFDDAVTWLASSLIHDQGAIREFRDDPAVRAYVHYGKTGE
ncbi:hypothetical protein MACH21_07740 [Roseicyclus marinus]|uniref:Uncharacterized protein n=1 Tax=Roseicyclus marinus TaxID=2161673 RepID=A0AA48KHF2_9RHOB|nr:hypothetical protein MACH21_07740 [Roseicyclus marinus]